jgi:hypothetical protein
MTTNRTPINRDRKVQITPAAVEAYTHALAGNHEAFREMHRLLGWSLLLRSIDIFEAVGPPPRWMYQRHWWVADWQEARAILLELKKAARERGRARKATAE